ncbi:SlyX family protein [Marinicella litoralis]|nr:SlyX family protein [Marinicella litoralis]
MTTKPIERPPVTENKLIDLETRIAFLEDTADDLNKMVYQQTKKIDDLLAIIQNLSKHMKQVQSDISDIKPMDEVPPHY